MAARGCVSRAGNVKTKKEAPIASRKKEKKKKGQRSVTVYQITVKQ